MTSADHPSGSDRVAEVAARSEAAIVLNVQGDEPDVHPDELDELVQALVRHDDASIATLATPIRHPEEYRSPDCVKVVLDGRGRALYCSRSPLPTGPGTTPAAAAR